MIKTKAKINCKKSDWLTDCDYCGKEFDRSKQKCVAIVMSFEKAIGNSITTFKAEEVANFCSKNCYKGAVSKGIKLKDN